MNIFARSPWLALLGLVLLLSGCQALWTADSGIVKPRLDDRSYRHLMLDNGLRVLLVSAPDSDKAAAALDVDVGSRQDPDAYPGMAHFLEHMLFLGTQRYPQAGSYQAFISAHGGSHNAYTAFEHTNYFFDINPQYLEPALDRFSEFFVAPLLQPEYIDRERHAVNSEYSMGIRDDARRAQDVLKAVVNPQHPLARFSVGSLQTLNDGAGDGALQKAVRDFYQHYYRAERMTLTVIGTQSLSHLEDMVRQRFVAVPSGGAPAKPLTQPVLPPDQLPQWVTLRPVRETREISITWPVTDPSNHWREKPLQYIGNILGHEAEGSLLSRLKQRGWAQGLSAGSAMRYHGGALFRVSIELTEEGVEHAEAVVGSVYQALARIRQGGVQDWLYQEQAILARQQFDYREHRQPIHDASALASNLQEYPAPDVLWGAYAMEHFDAELIEQYLTELTPQRALIMLAAPSVRTNRSSPWYQVPYASQAVSPELLKAWANAEPDPAVTLPAPNPYVADKLEWVGDGETASAPRQLDQPGVELWFRQDPRFQVPRTNVYINLRSAQANATPRQSVLTELYVRMVKEELNEAAYPAYLAGLNLNLRRHLRGITLELGGFSARQELLLQRVMPVLANPQLDPDVLARVARDYREELANRAQQAPYKRLLSELQDALYSEQWPLPMLQSAAHLVTREELSEHIQHFLQRHSVQMLVHGNATPAGARQLAATVTAGLPTATLSVEPALAVTELPQEQWRYGITGNHPDAALVLYLQAQDLSLGSRAAMGVGMQVLEAPFYQQIRTEQQLGYVVFASPYPVVKVPGALLVVQSPVAEPEQLQQAFRQFLEQWQQRPQEQLKPLFEQYRRSLAQQLGQAPKNLEEAGQRYWQDLSLGETGFDSREQLREAVLGLTFEDWYQKFRNQLLATPRALWLYYGEGAAPAGRKTGSWLDFRAGAPRYEFE